MTDMEAMDIDTEIDKNETENKDYRVNSLPWVEKYRPKTLTELIAHEEIIQILNKLIDSNKLPHLLFHGPPGTGNY